MKIERLAAIAVALLIACKGSTETAQQRERFGGTTAPTAPIAEAPPAADAMMSKVIGLAAPPEQATANGAPASSDAKAIQAGTGSETAPSMLIRTGSASIEVEKLDPAVLKVRQLASKLGGYIANSSVSGGRDQTRSAILELKVPAARYDEGIGGLGGIGKVESVNTTVDDVGEEYVDIGARVTNSRRLEERLVTLLAERTGKLQDVLSVERELARVREEIERYEGRMRFLRTRAAMSTLSITLHEPVPLLGQRPGENPIGAAVKQAWRNFVGFVAALIASLGVLIPIAVLALVAWYLVRRYRPRKA